MFDSPTLITYIFGAAMGLFTGLYLRHKAYKQLTSEMKYVRSMLSAKDEEIKFLKSKAIKIEKELRVLSEFSDFNVWFVGEYQRCVENIKNNVQNIEAVAEHYRNRTGNADEE